MIYTICYWVSQLNLFNCKWVAMNVFIALTCTCYSLPVKSFKKMLFVLWRSRRYKRTLMVWFRYFQFYVPLDMHIGIQIEKSVHKLPHNLNSYLERAYLLNKIHLSCPIQHSSGLRTEFNVPGSIIKPPLSLKFASVALANRATPCITLVKGTALHNAIGLDLSVKWRVPLCRRAHMLFLQEAYTFHSF